MICKGAKRRFAVILALAAALTPFPVAGQGAAATADSAAAQRGATVGIVADTSKAVAVDTAKSAGIVADTSIKAVVVDTVRSTSAVVDTSTKAVVVDTAKSARMAVDTSTKIVAVDTAESTGMAADTSTKNVAVDTAKSTKMAVDTPKTAAAIDTSKSTRIAADTAKSTGIAAVGTDTSKSKPKSASTPFAYTFHILFFAISVTVIALTVRFFLTRRDSRRFLTTTRLSVLDKTVQRGCRYIESNYGDPRLTPVKVCKAIVTGQSYLDALFMNELGINVHDFIVQVRVNAIKNALASMRQEALDLPELCVRCGFKDRAEAEAQFARICGGVGIAEYGRSLRR